MSADCTWKFYSAWELLLDSYSNTTILLACCVNPDPAINWTMITIEDLVLFQKIQAPHGRA
jgi:hypothetical protein